MHQMAPAFDRDTLYRSLNADLQRRIETMGRSTPATFGTLTTWEIRCLAGLGVAGPLMLAWLLL